MAINLLTQTTNSVGSNLDSMDDKVEVYRQLNGIDTDDANNNADKEKTTDVEGTNKEALFNESEKCDSNETKSNSIAVDSDEKIGNVNNNNRIISDKLNGNNDNSNRKAGGYLIAVHRKMSRHDAYFVSYHKSRPSLFGVPLLIPCYENGSNKDLYCAVWIQIARLLSPLPSTPPDQSNHATDW